MKSWQWLVVAALSCGSGVGAVGHPRQRQAEGKLVVDVKADYKPFGYTDPGKIVGLEVDLANDVAKRLGVSVELVPVIATNRVWVPQAGTHRPDDRDHGVQAGSRRSSDPGAVLLRRRGHRVREGIRAKTWADLKDKPITGIWGARTTRKTGEEFGAQLVVFKGVTERWPRSRRRQLRRRRFDTTFFAASGRCEVGRLRMVRRRSTPSRGAWACARTIRSSRRTSAT
jgi:polar amino acid transport system substrate-binding protein